MNKRLVLKRELRAIEIANLLGESLARKALDRLHKGRYFAEITFYPENMRNKTGTLAIIEVYTEK